MKVSVIINERDVLCVDKVKIVRDEKWRCYTSKTKCLLF